LKHIFNKFNILVINYFTATRLRFCWALLCYQEITNTRLKSAFRIGFGVSTKTSELRSSGSAGFRLSTKQIIHELSDPGVQSNLQAQKHESFFVTQKSKFFNQESMFF